MDKEERLLEEAKLSLERTKVWLGFAKFFVGTAIVGITSTVLNQQLKYRELDLGRQQSEIAFISKFADGATDINTEKRRDLAQYFSEVSPTKEVRLRWKDYYVVTETRLKDKRGLEKSVREQQAMQIAAGLEAAAAKAETQAKAAEVRAKEAEAVGVAATAEAEAQRLALDKARGELQALAIQRRDLEVKLRETTDTLYQNQLDLADLRSEDPPTSPELIALAEFQSSEGIRLIAEKRGDTSADALRRLAIDNVGNWITGYPISSGTPPPSFGGYFIKVHEDSFDYYAKGVIVRGIGWDRTEHPEFRLEYGRSSDGESTQYMDVDKLAYLGGAWSEEYKGLSDLVFDGDAASFPEKLTRR